jgi:hypothetical protein
MYWEWYALGWPKTQAQKWHFFFLLGWAGCLKGNGPGICNKLSGLLSSGGPGRSPAACPLALRQLWLEPRTLTEQNSQKWRNAQTLGRPKT